MEFNLTQKTGAWSSKLGLAMLLLGMGAAQASSVDINFNDIVAQGNTNAGPPGTLTAGTSVDLTISDTTTPDVLQFQITTHLTGKQELNRLYLDLPTAEASALTAITGSQSTLSNQPETFKSTTVSTGQTSSEWSKTQLIIPNSATALETGKNDLLIAFTAGVISGSGGTGVSSETFDLTFSGATVTADDFLSLKALSSTGTATNYNGFAEIALQGGTTGSGTGDLAGTGSQASPSLAPEPATLALLGLGFAGIVKRSRKA